jgi:hypothetical protein
MVRAFACMSAVVDFQGATLDKASVAPLRRAMVRPFISMYSFMPVKVRLSPETLRIMLISQEV